MRFTITTKLFLGFLAIVFLNTFYMVVVRKITDLKAISHILEKQDWTQQSLLKVSKAHSARQNNRIFVATLYGSKRDELVDKFRQKSDSIAVLLEIVMIQLDSIQLLDASISSGEEDRGGIAGLTRQIKESVARFDDQYVSGFEDLVTASKERNARKRTLRMASIGRGVDKAGASFEEAVLGAREEMDRQTQLRIEEIEERIDNSRQVTMVILIGVSVFALGFALVFSSAITKRLRKLRDSASYIGKGDFYFDPSGYAKDEIGDLSAAFFDMAINLKKSQEELVKSKRLAAIGEIVASVNHEINNPLMIISGNAQFLEMSMQEYPDEIKERVHTIQAETERISEVTRKLREIKNPVAEDYTSSGEQMINLDKSSGEL